MENIKLSEVCYEHSTSTKSGHGPKAIKDTFYYGIFGIIINYFVKEFKTMDNKNLKEKIKEVEEQMKKLTLEKTEELKVKDDKINELMLRLEKTREQDILWPTQRVRQTIKSQEERKRDREYLRSLGIYLEEVKDQKEELLDKIIGLEKQNKSIQRKLDIAVLLFPSLELLHSSKL